jgi:chromosome segregation ATPase
LTFAIGKFKEMVHNIELAIKSKEYENLDIEKEIKKMELVNQKIRKLNKESEESIDSVHLQNEEAVQQIYELEDRLGTYNKLIDVKEKQNKESLEVLISKTEELEQLKHRKDYIDKLIEGETAQQRELTKNQGELESILSAKQEKLMFVEQDNK